LKLGVAMVPEERAMQSIFPTETLIKHCSIGRLDNFSRAGFMDRRGEHQFATEVIERFRVNCSGATAEIESLSVATNRNCSLVAGSRIPGPCSFSTNPFAASTLERAAASQQRCASFPRTLL